QSAPGLDFARALQGVGGAIVTPLTLTLLSAAVPKQRRGLALGAWSGIGGLARAGRAAHALGRGGRGWGARWGGASRGGVFCGSACRWGSCGPPLLFCAGGSRRPPQPV